MLILFSKRGGKVSKMDARQITFGQMKAVLYGKPVADAVQDALSVCGGERVFVLSSGTLNRETDAVSNLIHSLGDRYAGLFDTMKAHTPRSAVIDLADALQDSGADTVVTFGGGSVTDAAKAAGLCLANEVRTADGMDRFRTRKGDDGKPLPPDFHAPTLSQIAIPTTLSAGEFSAIAGVTDERNEMKEIFGHPGMMPKVVILDPTPTRYTPEWLFLSTGVRAVDHCVEGICSLESNPFGDAQALRGLDLLVRGLVRVKQDPEDLEARQFCQIGAWLSMGPLSSGVPMGASHGIGYVLGAAFGIPHGHTSCLMLPAVMQWNKPVNADRQALVTEVLQKALSSKETDAGALLDDFLRRIDMPRGLTSVGVQPDSFPRIAAQAMGTPWVPRNPRPIPGPAEILEILAIAE